MNKPEFDEKLFPHWTKIPIRFRDLDPLNHVNNAIFSTFYEEARVSFIADVPAFIEGLNDDFSFVLANINIDFVQPVEYPAQLLVGSGLKTMGRTSITSFQAIYHAESKKLVSVAEASGVWFNLENRQPAPVPEIENVEELTVKM